MNTRRIVTMILPVAVIVIALSTAWLMYASRPQPVRAQPAPTSPIVLAEPVREGEAAITIRALGTVRPVQEVKIRPRVTGMVVFLSPQLHPGGLLAAGEVLLRLDPTDYELEVRRRESALAKAKADLELEMGQQKVARAELEQLKRTLPELPGISKELGNSPLARREPQLAQARAAVAAAEAELATARVNLDRTTITAPFNALVVARDVSLGSQAGLSDVLATLVDTDAYWVEATVPLDRLAYLRDTRADDLPVTIEMSGGAQRTGVSERVTGRLDPASRMGQVLVRVDDPLALAVQDAPLTPLSLNDQVHIAIALGTRPGVIILPRAALRGGDAVWVAADGTLDIRKVSILWRDNDAVYVSAGLAPGDLVITSDLAAPMQGMPVRLPAAAQPTPGGAGQGSGS